MSEQEETKIITLRKAVRLGSIELTQLVLHEPNAGEMERAGGTNNPVTSNILLIAAVAKVSPELIKLVPRLEYEEALDYLRGFTPAGPPTGEIS